MDGSTIVFVLIMMCLFMYTLKRKNAKEAPTRTVRNTKPAATAATKKPSPEPLPEAEPVPEPRVTQSDAHDVSRKRPVNNDMVEIVMTNGSARPPAEGRARSQEHRVHRAHHGKHLRRQTRLAFFMYRTIHIHTDE